jgi:mono/diheme cytochrome c family protein
MNRATLLVTASATLMLLAACGSLRRAEPIVGQMEYGGTSIKRGEQLYNAHCYQCHARGEGGLGPSLNDKPLPRFAIRLQIRHGLGVMPAFSEQQLSDQEVEDIVDYVVALRRQDVKK